VKDNPQWVKITPDGRLAITGGGGWLSVINLSDSSVRYVPVGTGYYETAIAPDGGSLVYADLKKGGITYYLFYRTSTVAFWGQI